ncbi:MAG: dihydropyrimidinase [Planctomycetes bacterium]|nr:dihydropyrimidinase [Planctomycetota bacterium]
MGILIRQGDVVTATDRYTGDIYVENGHVAALGRDLSAFRRAGDEVVEAGELLVFPGGIDAHTHMELPFMGTVSTDDFRDGTVAAALGGTTGIIDFAIPAKGDGLLDTLARWHEKANGRAVVDYAFHMAVVDWNERIRDEIPLVAERGVTSFKTFTAYKGVLGIDDGQLFSILRRVREAGGLVTVHAVNGDVLSVLAEEFVREGTTGPEYHYQTQPNCMEAEATHRSFALAGLARQGVYIVHMTCGESLDELRQARRAGLTAYGETCVQYALLDESLYHKPDFEGAKYVLSPPLRSRKDTEEVWRALADGTLSTVATDHCPFNFQGQKDRGRPPLADFRRIPNGLPGVEERMSLLYTYGVAAGRISLNRFVQLTSTNVARIFGLHPRKGTIAVGSDADLVLYDPRWEGTYSARRQASRCDTNVYEGWRQQGRVVHTIQRGRFLVRDGRFVGEEGGGRFIERPRFDPLQAQ